MLQKKELYSALPLFKIGSRFYYPYETGNRIGYLKCQKLCSKKICVLHRPFSKSGQFFAISMKRVTVSVTVSKFTLLYSNIIYLCFFSLTEFQTLFLECLM